MTTTATAAATRSSSSSSSSSSFDFGDDPSSSSSADGGEVLGIPTSTDHSSHTLSTVTEPSKIDGHPILTVNVSQREKLVPDIEPMTTTNVASIANISRLRSDIEAHLTETPCMVILFGAFETEFVPLMAFARSVATKSKGQIPVALCAPNITGPDVIGIEMIPSTIIRGVSVFYYAASRDDFFAIRDQFAICARLARESKKDISPIRLLLLLDKAVTLNISKLIRDEGDDQLFLFDDGKERKEERKAINQIQDVDGIRRFEATKDEKRMLVTKYFPQVEALQMQAATMVCKEWEATMVGHIFRNSHFPPPAAADSKIPKIPLEYLSAILAFHPFGRSFVIANALLPNKGEMVKKLLETWISTTLGTPSRFIHAM